MSDLVAVVYIGNKAERHDSVLRSGRIWRGRGASIEVPRAEAEKYFGYTDVWAPKAQADKILKQKRADEMSQSAAPKASEKPAPKQAAVQTDTSERGLLIQGAILQLDPDKDYEGNTPKVGVLVDVLGFNIEAKELEAAINDLRATGKLPQKG